MLWDWTYAGDKSEKNRRVIEGTRDEAYQHALSHWEDRKNCDGEYGLLEIDLIGWDFDEDGDVMDQKRERAWV